MAEPDPFEALGLAPTTDLGAIKRAYFAALQRHPPHQDPEGFRRVRTAYEALQSPEARALRAVGARFDPVATLAALEARYGGAIAAAREAAGVVGADAAEDLATTLARMPLREAIERVRSRSR